MFRTFKQNAISFAAAEDDDDRITRTEHAARVQCDGSYEADFNDGADIVNVYYWIVRPGGRLVRPEIETRAFDATTGDEYEFLSEADIERSEVLALDDWTRDREGLEDYYSDL